MGLKANFGKTKYELAVFAVLLAQAALRLDWSSPVDGKFLTFYLLDFKVGFVSRALIGSFVSLLTDKPTEKWLTGFIFISVILIYIILAFLVGRVICSAEGELKNTVIFLTAVFLLTSFSVRVFLQYIGLPDIYLFLFALLAAACMRNKAAKWFVPLLCFMGLAVHMEFALTFLPLILVLLFYGITEPGKKATSIFAAAAGFLASAASGVYFAFFANSRLKMDSGGVFAYLTSKADFPVWKRYYEGHLFYTDTVSGQKFTGLLDSLKIFKETGLESVSAADYATSFIMMLPMLILFLAVWKNAFKAAKTNTEKLVFLMCAALPLPVLPAFIFSTDMPRFLGEIFIVQFIALFYMIFVKNSAVISSLRQAKEFFKKYPLLLILFTVFSLTAFIAE